MIRDDDDPSCGCDELDALVERHLEHAEFVIDGDAQRLEDPSRRVPATAVRGRDRVGNDRREFSGRGDRAVSHDGIGDAPCEPLLAVQAEQLNEFRDVGGIDEVARGRRRVEIHAHIEWTLEAVAESPPRLVELVGADAEVKQNGRDAAFWREARLREGGEDRVELVEAAVADDRPSAEGTEAFVCGDERLLVLVDPDENDVAPILEDRRGVAATTHRRVDDDARRAGAEEFEDLVDHHCRVEGFLAHPQLPDRCPGRREPRQADGDERRGVDADHQQAQPGSCGWARKPRW